MVKRNKHLLILVLSLLALVLFPATVSAANRTATIELEILPSGDPEVEIVSATVKKSGTLSGKLTLTLKGTDYSCLVPGTYEDTAENGDRTENWIYGTEESGNTVFSLPYRRGMPYSYTAVSEEAWQRYLTGRDVLEKAFYPFQFRIEESGALLRLGTEWTVEYSIEDSTHVIGIRSTPLLVSRHGPNSPAYECYFSVSFDETKTSYSGWFLGEPSQAGTADVQPVEFGTVQVPMKWTETPGDPSTLQSRMDTEFTISLYDRKKGEWTAMYWTVEKDGGHLCVLPFVPFKLTSLKVPESVYYSGGPRTVNPTVHGSAGYWYLSEGRDFITTYENNVEVGTATVIVTGTGGYTGTLTATFQILPSRLIDSLELSSYSMPYTGNPRCPKTTVRCGDYVLGHSPYDIEEYEVIYENNINPGRATVTVTVTNGVNRGYIGTLQETFLICFTDVPLTHNYHKAVYWALDRGLTTGYTDGSGRFGVKDPVTRGQFMMFLWRLAGRPEPAGTKRSFADVPVSSAFFKAVQWAKEQRITTGYTDGSGRFGVKDPITRGQMMTFLWRLAGRPEPEAGAQAFTDVPKKHAYYKAVQWARQQGITAGYADGTFGVRKNCTRGQCIQFLYKQFAD